MASQATPISQKVATCQVEPGTSSAHVNVGSAERLFSVAAGGVLTLTGLSRGTLCGLGLAGLGGALLYRGFTGHCHLYGALCVNTAGTSPVTSVPAGSGVKVERSIVIDRPASELYRYWRNLQNLPRVMSHLKEVHVEGDRSHWKAEGPMGYTAEWDAEIVNDQPNELIAWRSLEGSSVSNAGSVHFESAGDSRGTEVKVILKYDPPMGKIGAAVAKLFWADADAQIADDLKRFKETMESGRHAASGTGRSW